MRKFNEWLRRREINEMGTGTNSVAIFARPIMPAPISRTCMVDVGEDKDKPKRKKDKKK